jgi:hypothetical protein
MGRVRTPDRQPIRERELIVVRAGELISTRSPMLPRLRASAERRLAPVG